MLEIGTDSVIIVPFTTQNHNIKTVLDPKLIMHEYEVVLSACTGAVPGNGSVRNRARWRG